MKNIKYYFRQDFYESLGATIEVSKHDFNELYNLYSKQIENDLCEDEKEMLTFFENKIIYCEHYKKHIILHFNCGTYSVELFYLECEKGYAFNKNIKRVR